MHFLILLLLSTTLSAFELPSGTVPQEEAFLLWAGNTAPELVAPHVVAIVGQLAAHDGDDYATQQADQTIAAKKGFSSWTTTFRFELPQEHLSGDFTCWMRWKQGGDPTVCPQALDVSAGEREDDLKPRASFVMKPQGWTFAWVEGGRVTIEKTDRIIEVRISGKGHDAKVFQAFYLAGPPRTP